MAITGEFMKYLDTCELLELDQLSAKHVGTVVHLKDFQQGSIVGTITNVKSQFFWIKGYALRSDGIVPTMRAYERKYTYNMRIVEQERVLRYARAVAAEMLTGYSTILAMLQAITAMMDANGSEWKRHTEFLRTYGRYNPFGETHSALFDMFWALAESTGYPDQKVLDDLKRYAANLRTA